MIPTARIALSTASVYPESTAAAFEIAARLGYDGVEVMVWTDPVSQSLDALRRLSDYHGIPVLAIHAPCLVLTQRVWSTDPWIKLTRAQHVAEALGAPTVVVHPPFRWQREYARSFVTGLHRMTETTAVRFAVENMFPARLRGREVVPYAPDWSPVELDFPHVTLDLSHTSVSRSDALEMSAQLGSRLTHVHLADGLGSAKDEHLVPGRGTQPCAELLEQLAAHRFDGTIVVEINTRRADSRADREADIAEALAFARLNLAAPAVLEIRERRITAGPIPPPARSDTTGIAAAAAADPLAADEDGVTAATTGPTVPAGVVAPPAQGDAAPSGAAPAGPPDAASAPAPDPSPGGSAGAGTMAPLHG